MNARTDPGAGMQRAGGLAALYVAVAYVAAIPYFVLLVDYPSANDPLTKVALLRDNLTSMYLMHVVCFELVALAMIVVTVATYQRLRDRCPGTAQLAAALGLIHAGLLLASVQVFNYGMDTVVRLFATDREQAVWAWQVFEPVALALGGSGGQIVGGTWVLLVSVAAIRAKAFPAALNWLGVGIGTAGILSTLPALTVLEVVYELLMIGWFTWLGIAMLRSAGHTQPGVIAPESVGSTAAMQCPLTGRGVSLLCVPAVRQSTPDQCLPGDAEPVGLLIHGGDRPCGEVDVDTAVLLVDPSRGVPVDDLADVLTCVEALVELSCLHIWPPAPGVPV